MSDEMEIIEIKDDIYSLKEHVKEKYTYLSENKCSKELSDTINKSIKIDLEQIRFLKEYYGIKR